MITSATWAYLVSLANSFLKLSFEVVFLKANHPALSQSSVFLGCNAELIVSECDPARPRILDHYTIDSGQSNNHLPSKTVFSLH